MSASRLKSLDDDGMNVASFRVDTYHETHLDAAPHHSRRLGIADIELDDLSGPAVGLHAPREGGEPITADESGARSRLWSRATSSSSTPGGIDTS